MVLGWMQAQRWAHHHAPRQMNTPVADAFAARLAELQQQDRESQQRTQETLQRIHGLIAQLEAIELD